MFHNNYDCLYDQGYSFEISLLLDHGLNTLMNSNFFKKEMLLTGIMRNYVAYSLGATFDFQAKLIHGILLCGVSY